MAPRNGSIFDEDAGAPPDDTGCEFLSIIATGDGEEPEGSETEHSSGDNEKTDAEADAEADAEFVNDAERVQDIIKDLMVDRSAFDRSAAPVPRVGPGLGLRAGEARRGLGERDGVPVHTWQCRSRVCAWDITLVVPEAKMGCSSGSG